MRYTVILISILFYSLATVAQKKQIDRSREIQIGQGLPDLPPLPIINYATDFVELSAMSDKVIILDFFDTFCASCIEAMPRLAKVKVELGDRVEIIPVTWQPRSVIERFYKSNKYLKEHNVLLPTIVGDTLLKKYFPHQSISHTVWLYKGKVKAISHPDFVTVAHIRELIENRVVNVPVKDDFRPKQNFAAISTDREVKRDNNVIAEVVLSGYQEGFDSESVRFKKDSLANSYLSTFVNMDLLGATTSAWAHIKEPTYLMSKERIVWEVPDSSIYYYEANDVESRQAWNMKYLLSYKRVDTLKKTDAERARIVLEDLSAMLRVKSKWEHRLQHCLVIKRISDEVDKGSKEGATYKGSGMLAFLMDYSGKYPPVIDEAVYKGDIQVPKFTTVEELNEGLARYGLRIEEDIREIEKLIFTQQ